MKKLMVLGLATLVAAGSVSVNANEVGTTENISAKWSDTYFEKAKEYGIKVLENDQITKAAGLANVYRTISLVEYTVQEDVKELDLEQLKEAAADLGLEVPEDVDVKALVADVNYETMKSFLASMENAQQPLKRIELAEFLYDQMKDTQMPLTMMAVQYADVGTYHKGLEFLANARIMQGDNGLFRPNDSVTKEELAAVLVRVYERLTTVLENK